MKYQLVVQFDTSNCIEDFERLVAFETRLASKLGRLAEVDGHDFGASEFNVFILTDKPDLAFKGAHDLAFEEKLHYPMRAAYRELTGEEFVILWPSDLSEFRVS